MRHFIFTAQCQNMQMEVNVYVRDGTRNLANFKPYCDHKIFYFILVNQTCLIVDN